MSSTGSAAPRIETSLSAMMLTPRETEKLVIYQVAELARRRRERGLKLNFPESIALIAEALLDQTNLAGIGNLYAAELCFVAGVAPQAPVSTVPDVRRIVVRAQLMLDQNRRRARQSTTGDLSRGRTTCPSG